MDLMTAIAAGTKALEALKAIQDIDKSLDAATWKAKVAELMVSIADMKLALVDANDTIHTLEREKNEFREKLAFKADRTVYENGLLYEVFANGEVAELPFCQRCWTEGKFIRLSRATSYTAQCAGCKTTFDYRSVMHR
jgi:hypothetical protein